MAASDSDYAAHSKKLRSARSAIALVAVLSVLGAALMFFIAQSQATEALAKVSDASATAPLLHPIEGATTVGELRAALEREPWQVLGLNLFLAAIMFGLWIWSKRATLPAIITALGIYVATIVASGLYDPTTLVQGIFMKIVVIVALGRGVSSAVAARRLEIAR